jgi:hypothetical protein
MTISAQQAYEVRKASAPTDTAALTNVLARAFFDDPIMRWAIPSDTRTTRPTHSARRSRRSPAATPRASSS